MTTLQLLNVFLAMLFSGLLCFTVAQKRGRNPRLWGLFGFCFSFLGVALFLLFDFLDRKRQEKAPVQTMFFPPAPPLEEEERWFYIDKSLHQIGPVKLRDLSDAWEKADINENSYIWKNGMDQWKKIKETPEVKKDLVHK